MATATAAPVVTAPAAAKESTLLPARDSVKPKLSQVKDVPKSPVHGSGSFNSHSPGSAKKHPRPTTPHSSHHSVDHVHPHGCECHKCTYSQVTRVGEAYCPNPNNLNVVKDYETKVTIIQRVPEMRKVEKTFFVKQLVHEKRTQMVSRSKIITEEVETLESVPVVREVPRLKKITVHKIHEEFDTITDMVPVVEYQKRTIITKIPRCVMEEVDERITVPVIKEVAVVKTVQVPTGKFCERPIERYHTPGDYNILCKGGRHHGDHHMYSDESDDEKSHNSHSRDHVESPNREKPLSPIKTKLVPHHSKEPHSPIKTKADSNHPKEPPSPTKLKVAETKSNAHEEPHRELKPKVPEMKLPTPETQPKVPETKVPAPETKRKGPETKAPTAKTKPKALETEIPAPETKSKALETETPAPETKTKVPEAKTKVPETKSKIPESTLPKDGSA